jgi:homoserine kinase
MSALEVVPPSKRIRWSRGVGSESAASAHLGLKSAEEVVSEEQRNNETMRATDEFEDGPDQLEGKSIRFVAMALRFGRDAL